MWFFTGLQTLIFRSLCPLTPPPLCVHQHVSHVPHHWLSRTPRTLPFSFSIQTLVNPFQHLSLRLCVCTPTVTFTAPPPPPALPFRIQTLTLPHPFVCVSVPQKKQRTHAVQSSGARNSWSRWNGIGFQLLHVKMSAHWHSALTVRLWVM